MDWLNWVWPRTSSKTVNFLTIKKRGELSQTANLRWIFKTWFVVESCHTARHRHKTSTCHPQVFWRGGSYKPRQVFLRTQCASATGYNNFPDRGVNCPTNTINPKQRQEQQHFDNSARGAMSINDNTIDTVQNARQPSSIWSCVLFPSTIFWAATTTWLLRATILKTIHTGSLWAILHTMRSTGM